MFQVRDTQSDLVRENFFVSKGIRNNENAISCQRKIQLTADVSYRFIFRLRKSELFSIVRIIH